MSRSVARLDAFAPAKLNLFLHVIGRRSDGYHLLQSAFVLLDFGDSISYLPRDDGVIRRATDLSGIKEEEDLVVRAARLLKQEAVLAADDSKLNSTLGVEIRLEKKIPLGGGLGGGSSDAATTLLVLNQMWTLGFSREKLQAIGLKLGADVPFFLFGQSAFAQGVGEELCAVDLPPWWYLVLTPPVVVSTLSVFAHPELTRNSLPLKMSDFSANGLAKLSNDLQPVVLEEFPEVLRYFQALQAVSQKSVFSARMTGSGACLFAAFESERNAREAFELLQSEFKGFVAQGLLRHPFFGLAR